MTSMSMVKSQLSDFYDVFSNKGKSFIKLSCLTFYILVVNEMKFSRHKKSYEDSRSFYISVFIGEVLS